jgi:hypothetical protein
MTTTGCRVCRLCRVTPTTILKRFAFTSHACEKNETPKKRVRTESADSADSAGKGSENASRGAHQTAPGRSDPRWPAPCQAGITPALHIDPSGSGQYLSSTAQHAATEAACLYDESSLITVDSALGHDSIGTKQKALATPAKQLRALTTQRTAPMTEHTPLPVPGHPNTAYVLDVQGSLLRAWLYRAVAGVWTPLATGYAVPIGDDDSDLSGAYRAVRAGVLRAYGVTLPSLTDSPIAGLRPATARRSPSTRNPMPYSIDIHLDAELGRCLRATSPDCSQSYSVAILDPDPKLVNAFARLKAGVRHCFGVRLPSTMGAILS